LSLQRITKNAANNMKQRAERKENSNYIELNKKAINLNDAPQGSQCKVESN